MNGRTATGAALYRFFAARLARLAGHQLPPFEQLPEAEQQEYCAEANVIVGEALRYCLHCDAPIEECDGHSDFICEACGQPIEDDDDLVSWDDGPYTHRSCADPLVRSA